MLDELDAVTAAPEHHKVLLETDQIRVLETLIEPGDETSVHTHIWGGYLYVISWSNFVRYDDKRNVMLDSRMIQAPVEGSALLASPLPPHSLKNVGSKRIHVILTEFKNGSIAMAMPSHGHELPASKTPE